MITTNSTIITNTTFTPSSAITGISQGIVSQINNFLYKVYPENPNLLVILLALLFGYLVKSRSNEGLWFWVVMSLVFYGAMKYIGIGG